MLTLHVWTDSILLAWLRHALYQPHFKFFSIILYVAACKHFFLLYFIFAWALSYIYLEFWYLPSMSYILYSVYSYRYKYNTLRCDAVTVENDSQIYPISVLIIITIVMRRKAKKRGKSWAQEDFRRSLCLRTFICYWCTFFSRSAIVIFVCIFIFSIFTSLCDCVWYV